MTVMHIGNTKIMPTKQKLVGCVNSDIILYTSRAYRVYHVNNNETKLGARVGEDNHPSSQSDVEVRKVVTKRRDAMGFSGPSSREVIVTVTLQLDLGH